MYFKWQLIVMINLQLSASTAKEIISAALIFAMKGVVFIFTKSRFNFFRLTLSCFNLGPVYLSCLHLTQEPIQRNRTGQLLRFQHRLGRVRCRIRGNRNILEADRLAHTWTLSCLWCSHISLSHLPLDYANSDSILISELRFFQ